MKLRCQLKPFLDAVQLVTGVVPANATRPILLSIHLKADDDGLTVSGTDLEVAIKVRVDEVETATAGEVVVPAVRFHAILRELQEGIIELDSTRGGQLNIVATTSEFKIPLQSAQEYPELEFKPPAPAIAIDREMLSEMLKFVSVAAARDATRFQMHSVLFDRREEGIRLVSTDGKRLACGNLEIQGGEDQDFSQFIIPLKGVDLLIKVLSGEEADLVEFHLDSNQILYRSDRVALSVRLVEGTFPDYERAIPQQGNFLFDIPAKELMVALRQASLMTTKESNAVSFQFDGDKLILSTQAANLGESRIEVDIEVIQAPEEKFIISFNPNYLIDLLRLQGNGRLKGSFSDQRTAGLFTADQLGDSYQHVVMPLVTQE